MIEMIEQSILYRLIVIVVTLASFLQILKRLLGWENLGTMSWPYATDPSRLLIAALLGGFLFPIVIILVPGQIGSSLYDVFSFGDPSYLVLVGLILGTLFGLFYQELVSRVMLGVMGAIGMAFGLGFLAFLVGGAIEAIQTGGQWGAIVDEALTWGWAGAKIGAVLGLFLGALGAFG